MPWKSTTRSARLPYLERPDGQQQSLDYVVYSKRSYTVDHPTRPRPPEPLWRHPTPLALQSTLTSTRGRRTYTAWNGYKYYQYFSGGVSVSPVINTQWERDIRLKIQDLQANLSSAVAEWKKTADGFITFANTLRDIKRSLRGRGRKLNFCDVSSAQLAVNFGIKPVVSDLYKAMGALNDSLNRPPVFRVVATSKAVDNVRYNSRSIRDRGAWEQSDRCIAYVQIDPNASPLDLGNPAEWAWELIPFSFVVDWGLPVGDFLTSYGALQSTSLLACTVTSKRSYNGYREYDSGSYKTDRPAYYTERSTKRTVYTRIPLPDLPSWDPTSSGKALANAVALLHQLRSCT